MKNIENMLRSADARLEAESVEMAARPAHAQNENEFAPWD